MEDYKNVLLLFQCERRTETALVNTADLRAISEAGNEYAKYIVLAVNEYPTLTGISLLDGDLFDSHGYAFLNFIRENKLDNSYNKPFMVEHELTCFSDI